jgi:hypothetical protein
MAAFSTGSVFTAAAIKSAKSELSGPSPQLHELSLSTVR